MSILPCCTGAEAPVAAEEEDEDVVRVVEPMAVARNIGLVALT